MTTLGAWRQKHASGAQVMVRCGFVAEIGIDPDAVRGVINFYELPEGSLMMVPGARVQLLKTLRSKRLDAFGLPQETWRVAA